MHLRQCFVFTIFLSYTAAFYVWKSEESGDVQAPDSTAAQKRSPFHTWAKASTSDDTDSSPPTLKIRRRAQKPDASGHVHVEREIDHVLNKLRLRRPSDARTPTSSRASPVKRENNYNVETATPPSQSNSAAVDQDGADFSYFASVGVGSTNKEMYMLIDTGAANTWVMAGDCTTKACSAHNTFGPEDSKTLKQDSRPWNVSYGTGTVSGEIYNDTMSLAGLTIPMSFGAASETSGDFLDYPMDGILGLGRPASNELEVPAFMDVLAQQQKLTANLLGVNLQRQSDGATDGEINFGAYDKSKFDGDLSWIPSTSKSGLWEIPVDDAGVNGKGIGFKGKNAVIDTGTSFVLLPPDDAQRLHSQIPQAKLQGSTFELPCSSSANLQFSFAGVDYQVPPKDYMGSKSSGNMCQSNIIPQRYSGADDWLVGDTFLKNVYTVFDFDQDRIGFGAKKNSSSTQTSSTSAASSSSPTASSSGTGPSSVSASSSPTDKPLLPGPSSSTSSDGTSSADESSSASSTPASKPTGTPSGVGPARSANMGMMLLALPVVLALFSAA